MDVKLFEEPFHWQKWDNKYDGTVLKTANANRRIGLRTPMQELFGIRCRASPDGVSPMQVNLDDLLDALAENIPPDAHSVMMLLDQDMYEGDGDVFCAGRAYGGSRIAAVSLFRDQPSCAPRDDGHGWPSSHCAAYVDGLCLDGSKPPAKKAKLPPMRHQESGGPLRAAVEAATIRLERGIPPEAPTAQWLARVVVTTTHELCHCLGLDHCVYFACAMQGCGSVEEAQRQPPYACPVCLEKIAATIGEGLVDGWDDEAMGKSVRERYVKESQKEDVWQWEIFRAFTRNEFWAKIVRSPREH
ncbi:metalloprotease [Trichoderma cornu-damae]|uniref:Metalloprotease n=1 Tax=Trichoderma cornu-damae TaxID=654480 RepID=A0A9P8QE63_9HYPO|nr:metalloprotease [Trichoderma cornu-damae]